MRYSIALFVCLIVAGCDISTSFAPDPRHTGDQEPAPGARHFVLIGDVVDEHDQPLRDVTVHITTVRGDRGVSTAQSLEDVVISEKFRFDLDDIIRVTLIFEKPGYEPFRHEFSHNEGKPWEWEIRKEGMKVVLRSKSDTTGFDYFWRKTIRPLVKS